MYNGEEKILAQEGSKSNPIIFKLTKYKGKNIFDIRKYFYNRKTSTIEPTRKGISLTEQNYNVVKNILIKFDNEITNWFENNFNVSEIVRKEQRVQKVASNSIKFYKQEINCEEGDWKGPTFFEMKAEGGSDRILYNSNHPFYKYLKDVLNNIKFSGDSDSPNETADKIHGIISMMLVSFSRAKDLFENTPVINPETLFDTLLFNWGILLKNYANGEIKT